MSHFAKLNDDNVVIQVIAGPIDMNDDEAVEWVNENLQGRWIRTSRNTNEGTHKDETKQPFRKNYAIIGGTYDEERDAFIPPKYNEDFILDEEKCIWVPPTK
jgi:hypothetical protein